MAGKHTPTWHWLGAMQSLAVTHGKTHFPAATLQCAVPHWPSAVQGGASGPGGERGAAAGAAATGAGAGAAAGAATGAGAAAGW